MNVRHILTAGAFAVALMGGAFGAYAVVNAILEASLMTKFIVGLGAGGFGAMFTALGLGGSR